MAKQGFKVIDSDIHVVEPANLWQHYLESQFIERGPRPADSGKGLWQIGDRPVPVRADTPERQEDIAIRPSRTKERYKKLGRREGEDHSSPVAMLAAMDIEGLDLGVVFRTYTAHATGTDDIDPALAAAICRALTTGYAISAIPIRLGCCRRHRWHCMTSVSLYGGAPRRKRIGCGRFVLPNHLVKGRPFYDRSYDPLWDTAADLNVPLAFHGINRAHHVHVGVRYFDNFPMAHACGHAIDPCSRLALCSPAASSRNTIQALGDDNIVISTDWPHGDSSFPQALNTFLKSMGSDPSRRKIL